MNYQVRQRCNRCDFEHTTVKDDALENCPECGGFLKLVGDLHH